MFDFSCKKAKSYKAVRFLLDSELLIFMRPTQPFTVGMKKESLSVSAWRMFVIGLQSSYTIDSIDNKVVIVGADREAKPPLLS